MAIDFRLSELERYLETLLSGEMKEEVTPNLQYRIRQILRDILVGFSQELPTYVVDYLRNMEQEFGTKHMTNSEASQGILKIVTILKSHGKYGLNASGRLERRLESRIDELEAALVRLRSNPALEKKVAKLEEEVRKVRVASVVSENEGKEQEDIFKKYKAAEKKVFIIMPFAPIFDDVWKGGIERACNSEGFCCLRVDNISLSTWITEDIEKCIEMADVVISDITGNNPNVMFELGWALAKGKKPIVIRQQDDTNQVPFDVHGIRYISYINSWSGVESLCKQICKFIKSTSETLGEKPTEDKSRKKKTKS